MFGTVRSAKHGYNALTMRNVFRKIPRKEGDFAEEGEWRRVVEFPFSLSLDSTSYNWHTILLSASAVCLRENEVVFCKLPDNLSIAYFLSAEDVDAKFDARCSASQCRRMLNCHSLQTYEAPGLSKALDEEVFLLLR